MYSVVIKERAHLVVNSGMTMSDAIRLAMELSTIIMQDTRVSVYRTRRDTGEQVEEFFYVNGE